MNGDPMTTDSIEPGIRPLVDSLNKTGFVRTFSSCEGHYAPSEQTLVDRNRAEVRFVPATSVSPAQVEALITYILTRFKARYGLIPMHAVGYKLYTPLDEESVEETFVLELRPFNRFDPPERKRDDTDRAIGQICQLIHVYRPLP